VRIFGRRRELTEAELLVQIARSLRAANAPTPLWLYILCLLATLALACAFSRDDSVRLLKVHTSELSKVW